MSGRSFTSSATAVIRSQTVPVHASDDRSRAHPIDSVTADGTIWCMRLTGMTTMVTAAIDRDIDIEVLVLSLQPKAEIIRRTAERRQFLSPKSDMALRKLAAGKFSLARPELNALRLLIKRMDEEGISVAAL